MPQITLTYFNITGLAEVSRLVLSTAGQTYTDQFVDKDSLATLKPSLPFGQVPLLTVVEDDGSKFTLVQSNAIARYLAKRFGLAGATPEEAALADQWVDGVGDLRTEFFKAFRSEDKEKAYNEYFDGKAKDYYGRFDRALASSSHLVGNKISWADLFLFGFLEESQYVRPLDAAAFPNLDKFRRSLVENNEHLKKYVNSAGRPKSFLAPKQN